MKLIVDVPEVDYNYAKQQVADGITNPLKIFIATGIPLDKIRAEIEQMETLVTKFEVLRVIDKHTKE